MDSYESILAVGGKTNSLGRASEVIESVYSDPSRLEELFDCVFADDAWVRMRAIDSFEKMLRHKPEWAEPYMGRIFDDLTKSAQPSIQWHLAQIFAEVQLSKEQEKHAVLWLKHNIQTTDVDWIVSVNIMKALLHFQQKGLIEAGEVKRLFKVQEGHKSKSVRKKATDLAATI